MQTAVEVENHLIVAHEVTMHGYDRDALSMMAMAARDAMSPDRIEAIADKGYYKSEEILACKQAGIAVVVPKPQTWNASVRGQFDKADFAYDAENDDYICPAGEQLIYRFTGPQDGKATRVYWSSNCADCIIKDKCTSGKQRRIRLLSADCSAFAYRAVSGNTKTSWKECSIGWTRIPHNWPCAV